MSAYDLFNPMPETAIEARDRGLAKVSTSSPTWIQSAHEHIPFYPGDTATGEDLKVFLRDILLEPHHVNCYGAMIRSALTKGLLKGTGVFVKMKLKESHARKNEVYTIVR